MKLLYRLFLLFFVLSFAGYPAVLTAQTGDEEYRRFSVSVNAGSTMPDNFGGLQFFRSDLNRSTVGTAKFGAGLEYALLPVWSMGLNYGYTTVEGDADPFTTDIHSIGVKNWFNMNRLYRHHPLSAVLNPFLTFGFGYDFFTYESPNTTFDDTESYISFGLGLGVNLSQSVELFGQMDYHLGSNQFDNKRENYYRSLLTQATGGLRIHMGRSGTDRLNLSPARMYLSQDRYDDILGREEEFANAQRRVGEQQEEIDGLQNELAALRQERDRLGACCEELEALRDSLAAVTVVTPELRQVFVGALRDVNFEFDSSTLLPASLPILNEAVALLDEYADLDVVIEGHTDSVGSADYNMALSLRRADSVRTYLIEQGVDPGRIGVEGFGETSPIASNANPEGRAMNRRVVLRIVE